MWLPSRRIGQVSPAARAASESRRAAELTLSDPCSASIAYAPLSALGVTPTRCVLVLRTPAVRSRTERILCVEARQSPTVTRRPHSRSPACSPSGSSLINGPVLAGSSSGSAVTGASAITPLRRPRDDAPTVDDHQPVRQPATATKPFGDEQLVGLLPWRLGPGLRPVFPSWIAEPPDRQADLGRRLGYGQVEGARVEELPRRRVGPQARVRQEAPAFAGASSWMSDAVPASDRDRSYTSWRTSRTRSSIW